MPHGNALAHGHRCATLAPPSLTRSWALGGLHHAQPPLSRPSASCLGGCGAGAYPHRRYPLGDTQGRGRLVQSDDMAVSAIEDGLEGTSAVLHCSSAPWE